MPREDVFNFGNSKISRRTQFQYRIINKFKRGKDVKNTYFNKKSL